MSATYVMAPKLPTAEHRAWMRDMQQICRILDPHVETTEDGFEYVGDTAPDEPVRIYKELMVIGRANRWI